MAVNGREGLVKEELNLIAYKFGSKQRTRGKPEAGYSLC